MTACNVGMPRGVSAARPLQMISPARHMPVSNSSSSRQCTSRHRFQLLPPSMMISPSRLQCSPTHDQDNSDSIITPASTHCLQQEQQLEGNREAGRASRMLLALAVFTAGCALLNPSEAVASAVAAGPSTVSPLAAAVDFILHLDHHMAGMITTHGQLTYAILFAIVFCETGLVLTPFLPGDSLLFAAGAFAGMGRLDVSILMAVFIVSAVLGDAVNYAVGNKLGGWAVQKNIVKKEYIAKTEAFYSKYGAKTVVLARFVPIIRTFAPFVAGVGSMPYSTFALYNVGGAILWSVLFVGGGFFFGNLPFVQKNFTLVVLGIVVVSVVPVILEVLQAMKEGKQKTEGETGSSVTKAE